MSYEQSMLTDLKRRGWDVIVETSRDGDTFAHAVRRNVTLKKINTDRKEAVQRLYTAALAEDDQ